jgi:hypothetical protein
MDSLSMPLHLREFYLYLILSAALQYICTGAFRMSRVESLYAESGEPALATSQKILLCSYAMKLNALK